MFWNRLKKHIKTFEVLWIKGWLKTKKRHVRCYLEQQQIYFGSFSSLGFSEQSWLVIIIKNYKKCDQKALKKKKPTGKCWRDNGELETSTRKSLRELNTSN